MSGSNASSTRSKSAASHAACAAPAEMETEVTDVLEGALNTVPGIDEMRSTSSRGSSNITLTFNLEKDPDQAYQEVQQVDDVAGVVVEAASALGLPGAPGRRAPPPRRTGHSQRC